MWLRSTHLPRLEDPEFFLFIASRERGYKGVIFHPMTILARERASILILWKRK